MKLAISVRAEFMLKDSEFHPTEDAVVIGIEKGANAKDAFEKSKTGMSLD